MIVLIPPLIVVVIVQTVRLLAVNRKMRAIRGVLNGPVCRQIAGSSTSHEGMDVLHVPDVPWRFRRSGALLLVSRVRP